MTKYRPKDLHEMMGNPATVQALEAVLERPEKPHAFLFTGPSGCGKTTLARIVAERLGCRDSGLVEVDAADFRGIDVVRDIRQQMRLKPLVGDARAWILDECHRMTADAQSMLLKALEEAPAHVYFMLATTDPQKLIGTVVNRCMRFSVAALPESRIVYLLRKTAEGEGTTVPDVVLEQIARDCLGSPRAALVLLEKIIGLPESKMLRAVEKAEAEEHTTIELCRALVDRKPWKSVAEVLKGLQEKEPEQIRLAVLGYCASVLMGGENDNAFLIMTAFKEPFYNTGFGGLVRACYEAGMR